MNKNTVYKRVYHEDRTNVNVSAGARPPHLNERSNNMNFYLINRQDKILLKNNK